MSVTPSRSSFGGIGSCPHSGIPGPPLGPPFWSTSTVSASTVEVGVVDAREQVVAVVEHERAAAVV